MKREYSLFLRDILEAMQRIQEFIGDMTFAEFLQDDKTQSAIVRKLEIIGEAVKKLPPPVRKRYPAIPWSSMARMRDRLAHGYWVVDGEIVWQVVKEELPALKPQIEQVYASERGRSLGSAG